MRSNWMARELSSITRRPETLWPGWDLCFRRFWGKNPRHVFNIPPYLYFRAIKNHLSYSYTANKQMFYSHRAFSHVRGKSSICLSDNSIIISQSGCRTKNDNEQHRLFYALRLSMEFWFCLDYLWIWLEDFVFSQFIVDQFLEMHANLGYHLDPYLIASPTQDRQTIDKRQTEELSMSGNKQWSLDMRAYLIRAWGTNRLVSRAVINGLTSAYLLSKIPRIKSPSSQGICLETMVLSIVRYGLVPVTCRMHIPPSCKLWV